MKDRTLLSLCCLATLLAAGPVGVAAQGATGFENPYYTTGARIAPSTLVPSLRKWYLPQRLYAQYGWRAEDYTNYAREYYQIYNPIALEGVPYYDQYGLYITRGWEVYSWTENYPQPNGSGIYKDPRFSGFFRNVVIASSHSGQYHTSLMVGDAIRSSLTPLTFSKPKFDGVQWDLMSDKYELSVLTSRISHTGDVATMTGNPPISTNPFTNLYGVHGQAQVGDFARVGLTYVNAAHRNSELPFGSNSMKGVLSGAMNADFVRSIMVRLSDDSPEDGAGGALLSRWRIFINGVDHTQDLAPTVDGGLRRRGMIEASGPDVVTLAFNLSDFSPTPADTISDFRQIRAIDIGLVLANDYKVEVTTNRQTDMLGAPVYLLVMRAPGNVQDGSNQAYHEFRYGLPTGNRLLGANLNIDDLGGLSVRGEFVRNSQYRRFPNETIEKNQALATNRANAYYLTAQQRRYPWTGYAEAFNIDADYSTSAFIPTQQGAVYYDNLSRNVYEFVDDNDDQDELADWTRYYLGPKTDTRFGRALSTDDQVLVGVDEDNDDISDFNRNHNAIPDYAEPFLRYDVDPPEFLFGMDMNNNGVIDRYEDDTEADYPYKRGHRGYNAYVGVELFPRANLMAGHLREWMPVNERRSKANFMLLTVRKDFPERDLKVWLIANTRLVKDDIPDDVYRWVETLGATGASRLSADPMVARDAFVNTAFLQVHYNRFLPFSTSVKQEIYHQRTDQVGLRDQRFLGMINKGEYQRLLAGWTIVPRWKQTYRNLVPGQADEMKQHELSEILSLMVKRSINKNVLFAAGTEYEAVWNLRGRPDPLPPGYEEDAKTWTLAAQFSNASAYQGYLVTTNVGFQWSRLAADNSEAVSELGSFITVYAGLGTEK